MMVYLLGIIRHLPIGFMCNLKGGAMMQLLNGNCTVFNISNMLSMRGKFPDIFIVFEVPHWPII